MKKALFLTLIAFVLNVKAQIVFEHKYDSASTINTIGPNGSESSQLMIVKFEVSGERYVRINRWGKNITVYDMNHSLIQRISLSGFPTIGSNQLGDVLYLSEQLFDLDAGMEFMYIARAGSNYYTGIYNDDCTVIFSDTGAAMIHINFEQQQYPIYNTSFGTKMILSYGDVSGYGNMQAKVFSLPGTLSTAIQIANQNLIQAQGMLSNPVPNPSTSTTKIEYKLPKEISEGQLVFYDLQGKEIKRYKVDKTFDHLLISTADIPAGTYYYQLQIEGNITAGKKLVVIR